MPEFCSRLCSFFKRLSFKRNRVSAHPAGEEEQHDASQWPRQKGKAKPQQEEELDENGETSFIHLHVVPVQEPKGPTLGGWLVIVCSQWEVGWGEQ